MNERVKELMIQAGILYRLDLKPTQIDEDGTHTFQEINIYKNFDPEKFAELIVKECAKIANQQFEAATGLNDRDSWTAAEMKKHFGVEE